MPLDGWIQLLLGLERAVGKENALEVEDTGRVKGRIWESTNVQIIVGSAIYWGLRLLVEEAEAKKIDWDHSVESLKGWSDEFIFDSLYSENPTFCPIFGIYMTFLFINLFIYKTLARLLPTTILEYW